MLVYPQRSILLEYTEEVAHLSTQYSSLQAIRRSLPDNCWNKIRLEP
jgi:hypothetical protein